MKPSMTRPRISIVVFLTLIALSAGRLTADTEPVHTPVFTAGTDGYHTYRIPALLVTRKGTLLAFCEGRKTGPRDAGDIDLLLKRSFDGGKNWTANQIVWDDGKNTCGNPCPVIDARSGTIWLPLTHNLGADKEDAILSGTSRGTRTVWITKSDDDGATWARPVEITHDVKKSNWTWYATGPGVGIQLKSGRLLVPCDHYLAGSKERESHVIYSDDRGQTWKIGGIVGPHCNECQAVELADGSVMLNIRSYQGNKRRLVAISKDGGETFSKPVPDDALVEPVCQASIVRYGEGGTGSGALLFSNPASTKREKMTVRMSLDDGRSWPYAKELHPGPSGYSCLAVLPDAQFACLYERGTRNYHQEIVLAKYRSDALARER
jgi:sialidase-1